MTLTTISADGKPLEDFGLVVLRPLSGWADFPETQLELLGVAGSIGRIASPYGTTIEPRSIDIRVKLLPTTLAGRKAALTALYQALGNRLVGLTFADAPDREVFAILVGGVGSGPGAGAAELVDPEAVVELKFLAPDPLFYDLRIWNRTLLVDTAKPVPIGDAGSRLELLLYEISACTVQVHNGLTGVLLYEMTLTGTLTATQWLRVVFAGQRIRLVTGNPYTEADAYGWKGVDDVWPRFDPKDAPTITIDQGRGLLLGKRAYTA